MQIRYHLLVMHRPWELNTGSSPNMCKQTKRRQSQTFVLFARALRRQLCFRSCWASRLLLAQPQQSERFVKLVLKRSCVNTVIIVIAMMVVFLCLDSRTSLRLGSDLRKNAFTPLCQGLCVGRVCSTWLQIVEEVIWICLAPSVCCVLLCQVAVCWAVKATTHDVKRSKFTDQSMVA